MDRKSASIIALYILYTIYYTDGKGSSSSTKTVIVTFGGPPTVGGIFNLTCNFPRILNPIAVFWYKWNDVIYARSNIMWKSERVNLRPNDADFKSTKTQTLIFTDVGMVDDAVYKCIVEDDKKRRHEGQYTVTIAPEKYLAYPSQDLKLGCIRGNPLFIGTIIWKKDKSVFSIGEVFIKNESRFSLVAGNALQIQKMTDSDAGVYICYNDGFLAYQYQVSIYRVPVPYLHPLRGWRGIIFGIAVGILILGLLITALFFQYQPFKALNTKGNKR